MALILAVPNLTLCVLKCTALHVRITGYDERRKVKWCQGL